MTSSDDFESFEEIAENEANAAGIKMLILGAIPGALLTVLSFLAAAVRIILAAVGVKELPWWVAVPATLAYAGWCAYNLYGLFKATRGLSLEKLTSPPADIEENNRKLDELIAGRKANRMRKWLKVVPGIGLSLIAGIGVGGSLMSPAGLITAGVLIAIQVLSTAFAQPALSRLLKPVRFMQPGPKDTPEI